MFYHWRLSFFVKLVIQFAIVDQALSPSLFSLHLTANPSSTLSHPHEFSSILPSYGSPSISPQQSYLISYSTIYFAAAKRKIKCWKFKEYM